MSKTLILIAASALATGCHGPSSRDDHVTIDGGAVSDCGVDASAGPGTGSGACSEGGGGSGSSTSFDPSACASCLIAAVPVTPSCGDLQPDQLETAAAACGAISYAALGSGDFACARSLAWATVYGTGVGGNALAVDSACTVGRAAGAGQAACVGAVGVVAASGGYPQSLIDLVTGCPSTIGPACVLARDVRDKLMIARTAIAAFRSALPAATAVQDIGDWAATGALGPVTDGILRSRFPFYSVGAALDEVTAELQAHADALNTSLTQYCL